MKKRRRFPFFSHPRNAPKRDEYGRSQRRVCFDEFDRGMGWQDVAQECGIKPTTCRRYYQTWKKLPEQFEQGYVHTLNLLKKAGERSSVVSGISSKLGLDPTEVEQILLRPWGLRSLLLACCGVKKIEIRRSESEKAALIRMERAIRKSGRSVKEVIQNIEITAKLKDDIVKMARDTISSNRNKEPQK